jgi:hypothetical protein
LALPSALVGMPRLRETIGKQSAKLRNILKK